jgi:hypothetical protein
VARAGGTLSWVPICAGSVTLTLEATYKISAGGWLGGQCLWYLLGMGHLVKCRAHLMTMGLAQC